tara:strand:+ start:199 stop:624 length:426 start_codon:yes stop_codon:yes gene_type:complete
MLDNINTNINVLFKNKLFIIFLKLVLVYYIVFVSLKLNSELIVLFDNSLIRLLIVICIFYISTFNKKIAILLMVCFVFSLYTLNKIKLDDLLNINQEIDFLETEDNKDEAKNEEAVEQVAGGDDDIEENIEEEYIREENEE